LISEKINTGIATIVRKAANIFETMDHSHGARGTGHPKMPLHSVI